MSRARPLLLALAGLLLPIGLALGIYLTSAGSLAAVPTVIDPPAQVARGTSTAQETSSTESTPTETTAGDDDRDAGVSDKCDEPEHRLDPECDPRNARDDSSGPGSGSNSGSGSNDSGGDSSGHGSGDDD
jgi:hypothetical protein